MRDENETDLLTLQSGDVFTLFIVHQERDLLVDVLALLYGHVLTDRLLVALKLQMADDVRDLLARLIRQLPVYLDWNFLTFLCHDGATARG